MDVLQLSPEVRLSALDTGTLDMTYVAQMPDGRQLQLSEQLYSLLKCLEKPHSLATLADDFYRQTGKGLGEDDLKHVIDHILRPNGLLMGGQPQERTPSYHPTSALAMHLKKNLISARHLYPITRVLSVLFTTPIVVILLLLVVVAHIVTYATLGFPPRLDAVNVPLLWVYVLSTMGFLLHELGHLSACQRWQCEHGNLGVGLYFFSPVFYVDVSPAWQLPRWKRVIVDVGGLYFQLLFTIIICMAFLATGQVVFLWVIVFNDMSALSNLNPLFKLDGYWLFSDLIGIPNLHRRAGEAVGYVITLLLYRLGIRKRQPVLSPFWQMRRVSRVFVSLYVLISASFWLLLFWIAIPVFAQALTRYPVLWEQDIRGLVQALQPFDILSIGRYLIRLLFPALILLNLGVLVGRLLAPLKNLLARQSGGVRMARWQEQPEVVPGTPASTNPIHRSGGGFWAR